MSVRDTLEDLLDARVQDAVVVPEDTYERMLAVILTAKALSQSWWFDGPEQVAGGTEKMLELSEILERALKELEEHLRSE